MQNYTNFSNVYDELMDNVPYEEWCDRIVAILKANGIEDGLVLDLGCGTGTMTRMLRDRGYDMIGVDMSDLMLAQAMQQDCEGILYLNQDMREFELYGTVRAVVCICDSLNYVIEEDEVFDVFKLVNNYLDPKGIFIFDMNTIYKYQNLPEDGFFENREDCSFSCENYFDEEEHINEYILTLFTRDEDGRYTKTEEEHIQRAYPVERIEKLIKKSGLELLSVYDDYTDEAVNMATERAVFVAREKTKRA